MFMVSLWSLTEVSLDSVWSTPEGTESRKKGSARSALWDSRATITTCGLPGIELIAFRTLLRSVHLSAFSSPVCRHFDSVEQGKFRYYRPTSSVKRCFSWKNDRIAHNNDQGKEIHRQIFASQNIQKVKPMSEVSTGVRVFARGSEVRSSQMRQLKIMFTGLCGFHYSLLNSDGIETLYPQP
jgi:hypothetical protein